MKTQSAGLLMYRQTSVELEVLLVHLGGPFWRQKDLSSWSISKGELQEGEDPLCCAKREFAEELGLQPQDPFYPLGFIKQKSGKVVHAWAFEGDCVVADIRSNTFEIEWPPKSGKIVSFPEVDRAEFFTVPIAMVKINPAQAEFLKRLEKSLGRVNAA